MQRTSTMFTAILGGLVLLSTLALASLVAAQTCTPPPSGLVSWWPGDGNANDIKDSNNGTLQGGMTFGPGEVAQAFSFNGTNADVKVPASATTDVGTSGGFTVDAWINPNDTSSNYPLIEWNKNAGSGSLGAHLWLVPVLGVSTIYANIIDTNSQFHQIQSAAGLIGAGVFQHIALTYDKTSGVATIYLNGAVVVQQNVGQFTPQTSYDLYFGVRPANSGTTDANTFFRGSMDEVQLLNRALTQGEIQTIVNAGSAGKCKGFTFSGFFPPVGNPPVVNVVKAGQGIPVQFSLNGYQGLNIFATGYPASQPVSCTTFAADPQNTIDQTVTAGGSSLSYDASTDEYTYVWKTNSTWADTCRQLNVKLIDGSNHLANFQFK